MDASDIVWDNGSEYYALTPEGVRYIKEIIHSAPDAVRESGAPYAPNASFVFQGEEYAIEEHEIILLGKRKTKFWHVDDFFLELKKKSILVDKK